MVEIRSKTIYSSHLTRFLPNFRSSVVYLLKIQTDPHKHTTGTDFFILLPQGVCILGPHLFNIYVHDVPSTHRDVYGRHSSNWIRRKLNQHCTISTIINKPNHKMVEKRKMRDQNILPASKYKSKSNKNQWQTYHVMYRYYLVVLLDTRVTWSSHINHILNKTYNRIRHLQKLTPQNRLRRSSRWLGHSSHDVLSLLYLVQHIQNWHRKIANTSKQDSTNYNKQIHYELATDPIVDFITKNNKYLFKIIATCQITRH